MPDASTPDSETLPQATSVTTVSGGINIDEPRDVNIGGDVVGRDKITNIGYTADEVKALLEAAIKAAREQAPVAVAPTLDELDAHYTTVVKAFCDGRVVPFLGFDANLCGRPEGAQWGPPNYLPNDTELAEYLAKEFGYKSSKRDLISVAQYVVIMNEDGPLYECLRKLFNNKYTPTALHQLLAMIPSYLIAKGYPPRHQLIVTTNYDDLMEQTLEAAEEPFDLVTYKADREQPGKFVHRLYGSSEPHTIDTPNNYTDLPIGEAPDYNLSRSIVLKLHGAVDRANADEDSYIITEDDHIDYLARRDMSNLFPVMLYNKLKHAQFLFMGYSLHDWNIRTILRRIWTEQKRKYVSWAIQETPEAFDKKFWGNHKVEILPVRLEGYVKQLTDRLTVL